jgi:DNA-binding XRE family transcriptional regulator
MIYSASSPLSKLKRKRLTARFGRRTVRKEIGVSQKVLTAFNSGPYLPLLLLRAALPVFFGFARTELVSLIQPGGR